VAPPWPVAWLVPPAPVVPPRPVTLPSGTLLLLSLHVAAIALVPISVNVNVRKSFLVMSFLEPIGVASRCDSRRSCSLRRRSVQVRIPLCARTTVPQRRVPL